MTLKKLQIKSGVNRENTRYMTEGGWYDCEKVRFRQGSPEKIGGWVRTSINTYLGVCRSIWAWSLLNGSKFRGIGTNLKFYLESDGTYFDVTPVRATSAPSAATFTATLASSTLTVAHTGHGAVVGDYVTFSASTGLGGDITAAVLNHEYEITTWLDANSYEIEASDTFGGTPVVAIAADVSGSPGGGAVVAAYQVSIGPEIYEPVSGWGSGAWQASTSTWGNSSSTTSSIRIWNQANFGQNLITGIRDGNLFIRDSDDPTSTRMTYISADGAATDVPTRNNLLLVSDVSRFVFVFGTNNVGGGDYDPMLIRWSDQESYLVWGPLATNQAGSLRLSRGSHIVAAIQARQEILVWTDVALYSLQYLGPPAGWGAQIVGENISIASDKAVGYANGIAYWMGEDKFYVYSGTTKPLVCNLRKYVFSDINSTQAPQIFSGTNEAFHEIWWFYCSAASTTIDKYVIYNYVEDIWYYGTMARTAWLDAASGGLPVAATYSNNTVLHESGVDDEETLTPAAIESHITSSQFDIDDGHRFAFVWRVIPDISFDGSTAMSPSVDMTLQALQNSGSGINNPESEGGVSTLPVVRTATSPVEVYTDQLNIRVRGRQMSIKIESSDLGVQWQLGHPRIDMRQDGRRG